MVCKSSNTTDAEILTLVVRISISLPMSPRLILGTVAKIDEDNGEADEEDEREPNEAKSPRRILGTVEDSGGQCCPSRQSGRTKWSRPWGSRRTGTKRSRPIRRTSLGLRTEWIRPRRRRWGSWRTGTKRRRTRQRGVSVDFFNITVLENQHDFTRFYRRV